MQIIHAAFSLTSKMKFYTKSVTNVIFPIAIKDFFSYQPKQFPFALNVYSIVTEQNTILSETNNSCIIFFNFQDEV